MGRHSVPKQQRSKEMVWMSMIVPVGFKGPDGWGLDNNNGIPFCRDGDIPQTQVDEEFPKLQAAGLSPEHGDCHTRGYLLNPAKLHMKGDWEPNFYLKIKTHF